MLKLDKIPVCQFLDNTIKLPYWDNMIDAYRQVLPTFPQKCPIAAGPYYVRNITNGNYDIIKDTFLGNFGTVQNGQYRIFVNLYSLKDPNMFTISWQLEIT